MTDHISETKTGPLINEVTGVEITDDQFKSLSQLVEMQLAIDSDISVMEAALDKLKEKRNELSTTKIPDLMNELGLSEVRTRHGAVVTIKPYYSAKIPEGGESKAFKWLRANGHDGIIKNLISINFGKGSDEEAAQVKKLLLSKKVPFEQKETIHSQTLKAFVKEMLEKGEKISHTMFGIYVGNVTKIEMPTTAPK